MSNKKVCKNYRRTAHFQQFPIDAKIFRFFALTSDVFRNPSLFHPPMTMTAASPRISVALHEWSYLKSDFFEGNARFRLNQLLVPGLVELPGLDGPGSQFDVVRLDLFFKTFKIAGKNELNCISISI